MGYAEEEERDGEGGGGVSTQGEQKFGGDIPRLGIC